MTDSFKKFVPALTHPIRWQVQDNKYDPNGANPKRIVFKIPLESIPDFCAHLMNKADNPANHKNGKVYDYASKQEVEVVVIEISGKGKVSQFDEDGFGAWGTINPQKIDPPAPSPVDLDDDEIPF